MARKQVAVHGVASDALVTLGGLIRLARTKRQWTQQHLGAAAGVSTRTVSLIERGDPAVSIGNVFNVAVSVGVPLFQVDDPEELARMRHRGEEILALIPKRVDEPTAHKVFRDF